MRVFRVGSCVHSLAWCPRKGRAIIAAAVDAGMLLFLHFEQFEGGEEAETRSLLSWSNASGEDVPPTPASQNKEEEGITPLSWGAPRSFGDRPRREQGDRPGGRREERPRGRSSDAPRPDR